MFTQASHKIFHSLHYIYVQPVHLPEITMNCCLARNKNVLYNNDLTTPLPYNAIYQNHYNAIRVNKVRSEIVDRL